MLAMTTAAYFMKCQNAEADALRDEVRLIETKLIRNVRCGICKKDWRLHKM